MARPKYPSDEIDKTMVRFPAGLMTRLKASAAENHRSMNAEIIARLEASFDWSETDREFHAQIYGDGPKAQKDFFEKLNTRLERIEKKLDEKG